MPNNTAAKATGLAREASEFGSRLSVLETDLKNLRDDFHIVAGEMHKLAESFTNQGRKDWRPFWSAAGVILAVVLALGAALWAPIAWRIGITEIQLAKAQDRSESNTERSTHNRDLIEQLAALNAAKLTEIETQFAWECGARNERERQQATWINMLWAESHDGKQIPYINLPDVGPSNIGTRAQNNGFHEAK